MILLRNLETNTEYYLDKKSKYPGTNVILKTKS